MKNRTILPLIMFISFHNPVASETKGSEQSKGIMGKKKCHWMDERDEEGRKAVSEADEILMNAI